MVEKHNERERGDAARPNDTLNPEPSKKWWTDLLPSQQESNPAQKTALRDKGRTDNSTQSFLPDLEISDSRVRQTNIGRSAILDSLLTGDRIVRPRAERGADNKISTFTDLNGNEFTRRGEVYFNQKNPAQTEGVDLRIQGDGTVRMKDRETGIVRTTSPEGVEVTDYSAVNGGRATRKIEGSLETISFEDRGGRQRRLELERNANGAMVRSYTDGSGTTYTYNNARNESGKPLYTAVGKDGSALGSNFTVNADRSGNVLINNHDRKDAPDFAHRELNNGFTVVSGKGRECRVVTDAAGNDLNPLAAATIDALRTRMMSEVPPGLNMEAQLAKADMFRHEMVIAPVAGTAYVVSQLRNLFDGGQWDPKTTGDGNNVTNMEYEAYGNWQYGYLGRASGFSEQFLLNQAGAFQYSPDPRWGSPGFYGIGGSGNKGDDPEDTRFIQRGFASHRNDGRNVVRNTAIAAIMPWTLPL